MKYLLLLCISISTQAIVFGQVRSINELDEKYLNWFNKDLESNGMVGTSVDKAYHEILHNSKKGKTVIVAVIDSGVDIDHEDLKGRIWINPNEVPDNNIDDDNNGYVDDIHGWNFIGSHTGENIHYENLEYTRIVRRNDPNDPSFSKAKTLYDAELAKRQKEKKSIKKFQTTYSRAKYIIKSLTGIFSGIYSGSGIW